MAKSIFLKMWTLLDFLSRFHIPVISFGGEVTPDWGKGDSPVVSFPLPLAWCSVVLSVCHVALWPYRPALSWLYGVVG